MSDGERVQGADPNCNAPPVTVHAIPERGEVALTFHDPQSECHAYLLGVDDAMAIIAMLTAAVEHLQGGGDSGHQYISLN